MKTNTRRMTQLALLIAIQIVLTVTPLGFIPLGAMNITLIHIPVLIGAIVLGPKEGSILGFVFGLASMFVATTRPTPDALVFSPFYSHSWLSVVLAVLPRIIFPLAAGYIYLGLTKKAHLSQRLSAGLAAGIGSIFHTILVLSGIYLFFGKMYAENVGIAYNTLLGVFLAVVGTNGVPEAITAVIICTALVKPLSKISE